MVHPRALLDSDFIDVAVAARAPYLPEKIANAHAVAAIRYYGELRANAATATKDFLAEQLRAAAERLRSPDDAWARVPAAGGVAAEADAMAAAARQAREEYEFLLKKYSEAALIQEDTLRANHIQVVEPAVAPARPAGLRKFAALLGLSLVGSVGLGVLLAVLLESVVEWRSPARRWLRGNANGRLDDPGLPVADPPDADRGRIPAAVRRPAGDTWSWPAICWPGGSADRIRSSRHATES